MFIVIIKVSEEESGAACGITRTLDINDSLIARVSIPGERTLVRAGEVSRCKLQWNVNIRLSM